MKPKLLKLYRTKETEKWGFHEKLPTEGIWETISVHDLDTKSPYYVMRCVFPMHNDRSHLQKLNVWKEFIVKFMERVEIKTYVEP